MHTRHLRTSIGPALLASGCVIAGSALLGCERPLPPGQSTQAPPAGASGATAADQSNRASDVELTAAIRRAILEDETTSSAARNCTIVTDSTGTVTLKGAVDSQAEKELIESKARAVAGDRRIVSQLSINEP